MLVLSRVGPMQVRRQPGDRRRPLLLTIRAARWLKVHVGRTAVRAAYGDGRRHGDP
jgi:hypothetical protein